MSTTKKNIIAIVVMSLIAGAEIYVIEKDHQQSEQHWQQIKQELDQINGDWPIER